MSAILMQLPTSNKANSKPPTISVVSVLWQLPPDAVDKNVWQFLPKGSRRALRDSCKDAKQLVEAEGTDKLRIAVCRRYLEWLQRQGHTRLSQRFKHLEELELKLPMEKDGDSQDPHLLSDTVSLLGTLPHLRKMHLTANFPQQPDSFCCDPNTNVWTLDDLLAHRIAAACPSLEALVLEGRIQVASASALTPFKACRSLQTIGDLSSSPFILSATFVKSLACLTGLESLSLPCSILHNAAAATCLGALTLTALTRLQWHITPRCDLQLLQLYPGLGNLIELDITEVQFDSQLLSNLTQLSNLQRLLTQHTHINDAAWAVLLQLTCLTELACTLCPSDPLTALPHPVIQVLRLPTDVTWGRIMGGLEVDGFLHLFPAVHTLHGGLDAYGFSPEAFEQAMTSLSAHPVLRSINLLVRATSTLSASRVVIPLWPLGSKLKTLVLTTCLITGSEVDWAEVMDVVSQNHTQRLQHVSFRLCPVESLGRIREFAAGLPLLSMLEIEFRGSKKLQHFAKKDWEAHCTRFPEQQQHWYQQVQQLCKELGERGVKMVLQGLGDACNTSLLDQQYAPWQGVLDVPPVYY